MVNFKRIRVEDHGASEIIVIAGAPIGAGVTAIPDGVDVSQFEAVGVLCSTTDTSTLRPQVSDDNTNWYDCKTVADADISFNCHNEKVSFNFPLYGRYIRVTVTNDSAGDITCTLVYCGRS